ncbi:MAG TPA: hypothetical protein VFC69_10640 [Dysgonamonadaceae bacterium]|nr:hypothetical protein [Dysgonamonadaceae bacterium]
MAHPKLNKAFASSEDNVLLNHFNTFFEQLQLFGIDLDEMDKEEIAAKIEDLEVDFLDIVEVVRNVLKDNDINLDTLVREIE